MIVKLCEGMLPALSLSDWIGGLFPLVAVESIIADCVGVAELEVEGALWSVALQLVQSGEERGVGVVRVLAEGFRGPGEQSLGRVMAEDLQKWI